MIIVQRYLPQRCRAKKANRLLELADRGLARVEHALDIRTIVESHEDLQLLL
jgi:hypothetical protein